ncbi:MAG TPA: hypothetical protein VEF76_13230, partial [Patescibacteria group bacterium]|nr:hypothetical protein [Patescibacteria group bacterium]
MATRARNTAAEFFDAAQKVLDEQDRKDKQLAAELRATRAANRRAERERQQKFDAAFADYRKTLQPLLETLDALPRRNGEKFMVRVDKNFYKERGTGAESRGLHLWIAYARPLVTTEDMASKRVRNLPMPVKGLGDKLGAYPEDNARPLLIVKIERDGPACERIMAGVYSYADQLQSIEDIPAYIGKWVAN